MQTERLPLDLYEKTYGPLPRWFIVPNCIVVRTVDPFTNEAVLSIELPADLPRVQ